jgi:hypothetical protein
MKAATAMGVPPAGNLQGWRKTLSSYSAKNVRKFDFTLNGSNRALLTRSSLRIKSAQFTVFAKSLLARDLE